MRAVAALVAVLVFTACTPDDAIRLTFGNPEAGGSPALEAQAHRVVGCESEHTPTAVSPTNDHGLFQVNAIHRRRFRQVTGQPWSAVYDPFWNAVFAKRLHDERGWGPWTCRP